MAALFKVGSLLILGFGVFFLVQAVMPMLAYEYWELTALKNDAPLVAPIAEASNGFMNSQVLGISTSSSGNYLVKDLAYGPRTTKASYDTFTLSIPKLKIEQAIVKVDDDQSPDRHLILLPGMALPGERGNMFIAGHSNYFQLFGPDNWYLSIFKDLMNLKAGDEIIATAQGQHFKYKVIGMKVVDPKDLSVLHPPDSNGRYISVMTCVPPGTTMKRLIVLGKLE